MTRLALLASALLASALLLAACGNDGGAASANYRSESNNGMCVASTGRAAGEACTRPEDCGMACCACSGSSKRFSASACLEGVCASGCELAKATACAD